MASRSFPHRGRGGELLCIVQIILRVNKKELLARVQRYMGPGATRSAASAALEAVLGSVLALTDSGEKLQITRFGTFERKLRPSRLAYDIPTAKLTHTTAHSRLTFTPAKGFPERNV